MIIYAVVPAQTQEDALGIAKRGCFDRLVGAKPDSNQVFDYYTTFDEDDTTVSGEARWGEKSPAVPLESDTGQEWFENAKQSQWEEFKSNYDDLEELMDEMTPYEIYNAEDEYGLARYKLKELGESRGPNVFLYDEHGIGLQTDRRINNHVNKHADDDDQFWIIPADVHF